MRKQLSLSGTGKSEVLEILPAYIQAAMRRAKYEILEDDGTFYGEIPGFQGVWSNADTLEECRDELEEVLEEWLLFRITDGLSVPVVDGMDLKFKTVPEEARSEERRVGKEGRARGGDGR